MRSINKEYRVSLSNGTSLRIVAASPQRAYARAIRWAAKNNLTVGNLTVIED